jgi:type IV pilus assembly protein PilB
MPPKASSIEDLFKKPAAGGSPGTTATPATSPTTPKPAKGKKPATAQVSVKEKLAEKMGQIELREFEKRAQERAATIGLPYIALRGFPIAPEALSLITAEEANKLRTVPFLYAQDQIRIGTTEPGPEVEALAKRLAEERHSNVETYFISNDSFEAAFTLYEKLPKPKEIIFGYRIEQADLEKYAKEIASYRELQEKIAKVSITDVVTLMMGAALKSDASDIHVEAEEEDVKIRFRVDGVLQEAAKLPKPSWKQIIGRLKLLAGVKINVEDVPQDGRITIYLANEKIDIRVSFLPTTFGESVVMRILRPKAVALEFDALGVRGIALDRLKREIERPNGMIITTGPTGSGKTTTLYAILKKLNTPDVKIITLEDPVEYKLQGINQSQIDHEKQYDFAKGLRSILRQDPDIVMVGEIRDFETADIAIQAALTGHLMVSTIHTNSAAGAIPRFLSMGVKPFLLAPALNAVIGQRLVRRLCPDCKKPAELPPAHKDEVLKALKAIPKNSGYSPDLNKLAFMGPGEGCNTCNHTGFKGRLGIYEIFTMNKVIEETILSKEVSEAMIQDLAMKDGMITMVQDGLLKALDGMTSVDEVLSVTNIDSTLLED